MYKQAYLMTWVPFISNQTLDTYIAERLHVHSSKKYAPFLVRVAVPACLLELHHTFWKIDSVFHRVWESSKVSSQRSTSCYRKLWFVAVKKNWANLPIINKSYWSSSCSGKQSSNQYLIQLRNLLFSFSFSIVICNEKKSRFTQYLIKSR